MRHRPKKHELVLEAVQGAIVVAKDIATYNFMSWAYRLKEYKDNFVDIMLAPVPEDDFNYAILTYG